MDYDEISICGEKLFLIHRFVQFSFHFFSIIHLPKEFKNMSYNWTITNSILCNCTDSQNCIKIKGIKFPILCLHKSISVDQFEEIIGSPFLINHNLIQLIGIGLIVLLQVRIKDFENLLWTLI